jgi:hypothetical protein
LKIFILEDDTNRIKFLFKYLRSLEPTCEIFVARTAKDAEKILMEGQPWDRMYLDHDLGGEVFVDSNLPNTGYQTAKFIKDKNISYSSITIHSMNPIGVKNMISILKDPEKVICVPFPLFL